MTLILTDAALKKIILMLHICGQPFSFILIEHKKCHCLLKQIAVLVLEMWVSNWSNPHLLNWSQLNMVSNKWYTFFKIVLKDWSLVKVPSSCMSTFLDPQIAQAQKSQYIVWESKIAIIKIWCTFLGGWGGGWSGEEGHFKVIPVSFSHAFAPSINKL